MRHSRNAVLASCALLLACGSTPVLASSGSVSQTVQWGRSRGRGYPGQEVIRRAMDDLRRAESYNRLRDSDRDHYNQARKNLSRFESNWSRGQFDKDRLDGAIENFQHLSNSGRIDPRTRQMLRNDMQALRDFRATGGRGGLGPGRRY